jgi:hypothetical protein
VTTPRDIENLGTVVGIGLTWTPDKHRAAPREALDELLAEVERLESARDAATRHAAELETILRATREELSESALRNDRLLNVLRGEEAMRREAEASRDRLADVRLEAVA